MAFAEKIIVEDCYENIFKYVLSDENYSEDCIGMIGSYWWLRTPGASSGNVCYVGDEGRAGADEDMMADDNYMGVRPALYISK